VSDGGANRCDARKLQSARRSGDTRSAIPPDRHQSQSRRQSDLGKHFQRGTFVLQ